ncbi:stevor PIR protein, putative [Plasmodium sp. gorilla clade G2]|uniref:stevor PIR protein, putative n=1 Tax=Plasmodium sp. gorilla clade G2 TaxID=880535 RepID=UPI000D291557|nr:stevor PIR protein, putative [Plasmodium sp. gorilla clade G2]SOV20377.1 stevor PIR protein, putative [Plasmodium sp. gorilla clade G2]
MLFYSIKLVIFSIILGTLTLIYNNDSDSLYKNLKYDNIVLGPINCRSLAELSHEHRTNQKHKNNQLREYQKTKEEQYIKNKYPNDDAKTKQKIPPITNKRFPGTPPNETSSKKKTYGNEKEEKSNISSRRLRYLEMQRKLYNDFDGKQELYFRKLSDQSDGENNSGTKKRLKNCCMYFPLAMPFLIPLFLRSHYKRKHCKK